MCKRHSKIEGISWKYADVRQMTEISTSSVDVAFDKGTLDAMIYGNPWDPPEEVLENTSCYIREVYLKDRMNYVQEFNFNSTSI